MLNHAIYKCCLFLCGGAVEQASGTAELENLGGLGKKMPITFAACTIAALSISGIPPFNGFVSKWMVYQGVIQMGTEQGGSAATLWPVWFVCAMFGSALTLASFVKLLHSLFLSRMPSNLKDTKEVSHFQTVPMAILAGLCVFFGIFYKHILRWLIYPALGIDTNVTFGTWQSTLATTLIIIGVIIGFVIWLIGKNAIQIRQVPTWYCGEKIDSDKMIIPGTHFYKTVTNMGGLKQLYSGQEKRWFDPYDIGSKLGLGVTEFLRWLHNGVLPRYLTWTTIGLLVILFVVCRIW
jgi:NADH:ubiquinone oxidoreductase subunit 5 (subunit L)/multisubunit Na+/H+ antiporter MnhA subunit